MHFGTHAFTLEMFTTIYTRHAIEAERLTNITKYFQKGALPRPTFQRC